MSTHALVGIEMKDGTVKNVYVHGDGYITGVGRKLHIFYQSRKTLLRVISKGSLSHLGELIGYKHSFEWIYKRHPNRWDSEEKTAAYKSDPRHLWCRFYTRDRGDSWRIAGTRVDYNRGSFRKRDFNFTYMKAYRGPWLVSINGKPWVLLSSVL